jgi:hypothetical protein
VEEEGPCRSLPEACSGRECILALERDDPSSKNAEGERRCKVMGNGTWGYVPAKDTLRILRVLFIGLVLLLNWTWSKNRPGVNE